MKLKSLALFLGLVVLASLPSLAQTSYSFQTVIYPKDTFTQLLGINNSTRIAGYHGATTNRGFVLVLPKDFINENYPQSAMTQVTGVNNKDRTSGFYVDSANVTHGFTFGPPVNWLTVDYPGTAFNQLLSLNDMGQASGYYSLSADNSTPDFPYVYDEFGGVFEVITIPGSGRWSAGDRDQQPGTGLRILDRFQPSQPRFPAQRWYLHLTRCASFNLYPGSGAEQQRSGGGRLHRPVEQHARIRVQQQEVSDHHRSKRKRHYDRGQRDQRSWSVRRVLRGQEQ